MMKGVKVGDLVRVSTKIHQEGIPSNRMGIVICHAGVVLDNFALSERDTWTVQMTNGEIMKFHDMWLEIVREA